MKVMEFDLPLVNSFKIDEESYFLIKKDNEYKLLPSKCSHRGGPLHYSDVSSDGDFIICPWHKNKFKPCVLNKKTPATVSIMNKIKIIVEKNSVVLGFFERGIINF